MLQKISVSSYIRNAGLWAYLLPAFLAFVLVDPSAVHINRAVIDDGERLYDGASCTRSRECRRAKRSRALELTQTTP